MSDQKGAQHINEDQFKELVLESDKPVLIDFYADWCGPCKMAAPILDDLSEEQSDVVIMKMNVDENPNIPREYGVMSIPTVIVFKDGKEAGRQIGFSGRAMYEDLIEDAKN
jgi:thioredoxin 1